MADGKPGRRKTTGKFKTRAELIKNVVELVDLLDLSYPVVGRKCGISETTVRKIYEEHWAMKARELSPPTGCFKCKRLHPREMPCLEERLT